MTDEEIAKVVDETAKVVPSQLKSVLDNIIRRSIRQSDLGAVRDDFGSNELDPLLVWRDTADSARLMYYTVKKVKQLVSEFSLDDLQKIGRTEVRNQHGTPAKVGKLITKVYPNCAQSVIEEVANTLLASRICIDDLNILSGTDITDVYCDRNIIDRIPTNTGNLKGSCMNGKPRSFFRLYEDNAELLTLKNGAGNLVGRALLWRAVTNTVTGESNTYLDRIYGNDQVRELFRNYGFDQGWWVRVGDNHEYRGYHPQRTGDRCTDIISFETAVPISHYEHMPYMDSLKHYKGANHLVSYSDSFCLNRTSGEWDYVEDVACPECGSSCRSDRLIRVYHHDRGDNYRVCPRCTAPCNLYGDRILLRDVVVMYDGGTYMAHRNHPNIRQVNGAYYFGNLVATTVSGQTYLRDNLSLERVEGNYYHRVHDAAALDQARQGVAV